MNEKEERRMREIENLKKLSPFSLPNNPSQSGWSTGQIKEKFYTGLLYLYGLFDELRGDIETAHDGLVVRDGDGSIDVPLVPTELADAASKKYVDDLVSQTMRSLGNISAPSELPSGANIGDTYNVTSTGDNYTWNGTSWDKLSGDLIAGAGISVNQNTISSLTTATDIVINIKDD